MTNIFFIKEKNGVYDTTCPIQLKKNKKPMYETILNTINRKHFIIKDDLCQYKYFLGVHFDFPLIILLLIINYLMWLTNFYFKTILIISTIIILITSNNYNIEYAFTLHKFLKIINNQEHNKIKNNIKFNIEKSPSIIFIKPRLFIEVKY